MAEAQEKATDSLIPAATKQSYASNISLKFRPSASPPVPEIYDLHQVHRKSVDLEAHGDIAITLIQNSSSLFGKCLDISRLIFSSLLLIMSIFSIIYAITEHHTLWPQSFPNWSLYIFLFLSLFGLGVLEGLQIAVVELAHEDPNEYKKYYPRAAKLLTWENEGRNVERFLIGRQVLVVLLVFVCARITTFDIWIVDVPNWVLSAFMFSGFLGIILTVIMAQLTPQVLSAAYPVEFLNLPGMNIAFSICLMVESSGIAHAVWLLCYTVKEAVYSCVCKYHHLRIMDYHHTKRDDGDHDNKQKNMDVISNIAQDIEMLVEDEESVSKRSRERSKRKIMVEEYNDDTAKDFTVNGSKIGFHIEELMQQMDEKPDLFYLFGDDKYPGPSYYGDKFKDAGCEIPYFLLPPTDPLHIPPHIVTMALLQKIAEDSKVQIKEVSNN